MDIRRLRKITPTKIKVAPHLVVEILSPSTAGNDRTIKKDLYERSGVNEFWIVDPFEQKVEQLVLQDGIYQPLAPSDHLELTVIENVTVRLEEVW